jgi:heme oxygenase
MVRTSLLKRSFKIINLMNSENIDTLHQLLKKQTIELHNQAHKIPYIVNFLKNNFLLISYIGHLRALAIIYGTLEYQLSNLENQEIKDFLGNYSPKLPLILSDLEYLKANEVKDIMPAICNALHVADKIMLNSVENPYKLLGYIYTLEGSLNGGNVLKKHIIETFNFQNGEATKYLSCFDEKFKSFWDNFVNNLNTKITDNQQKEDILTASNEIFIELMKIYEALFPIDEKALGNHITSLNPEAGNFPIPTNPLEIKAAISAGMNCWNEFPYYEKRYGERGRRFAVSDTVWLVTLSELEEEDAIKQVNWLANFLAIRGMPTFTMEFQIQALYHELSKSIPANEQKYLKLLKTSENIKSQRIIHINETIFENCNSIFYNNFDEFKVSEKICLELKKNIGKLIASSIIDDKNKIPDVKNSLEIWLKRKDIFPENWIFAVEKTYIEIGLLID